MTALLPLRPYQREAVDAVWQAIAPGGISRPAVVLPTGAGKTVCFAHMASEFRQSNPGEQVAILVHTDELVAQTVRTMRDVAPHLNVGVVKASQNDVMADVIVASVQTLRSPERMRQLTRVGLVVVDECHHATAASYRAILDHYGCLAGRVPAIGFTATLARTDRGPLGEIWQDVAYVKDISWMIRHRYLVDVRGKRVEVPDLDLSAIRGRVDYRDEDLGEALAESLAPQLVAEAYAEHAGDRSGIAFFPTVASAYVFADAFNDVGIKSEVVHGALPREERRAILARLESGVTQLVCNCMVLTEGFDSPRVSCIVIGRPTKSAPLYVQMAGRGLRVDKTRPYEEQDCLLLDVAGAGVSDLRSIVDLSTRQIKEPRQGASLVELEDEFDEEEATAGSKYYKGPVQVTEFDPLAARSAYVWKRTEGGTYFMAGGKDMYVFLAPGTGGTWSVAWATKQARMTRFVCCPVDDVPAAHCTCGRRVAKRGGWTEHANLDLEMAMGWGETVASDFGSDPFETLSKKSAPWRRKRPDVGGAAPNLARSLGIVIPMEETKDGGQRIAIKAGELSDLIDVVFASRRLDPIVKKMQEGAK